MYVVNGLKVASEQKQKHCYLHQIYESKKSIIIFTTICINKQEDFILIVGDHNSEFRAALKVQKLVMDVAGIL